MRFRSIALLFLLSLCLVLPVAHAAAPIPESRGLDWQENDPWPFAVTHGDRDVPQVAITMDDCYDPNWVKQSWELVTSYGGRMTFYPVGTMLKADALGPGDGDMWRQIAASGSEIGTHTHQHLKMTKQNEYNMLLYSKYPQYVTDQLLGYHYPLRTLRPPYGAHNATYERVLKSAGYSHVILWDVDSTDPDAVLSKAQNGSIILLHARHKDYTCLEVIVPELVKRGYALVTVSEMLNLPPLEPQDALFDWTQFKKDHNM